jgi:hypothetical protein
MPQSATYVIVDLASQSHFHNDIKFISGTHTITGGTVFLCDGSGGAFTITLPAAASWTERIITVKRTSAAGTITVEGNGSETVDGAANVALTAQYERVTVVSDGTNWVRVD